MDTQQQYLTATDLSARWGGKIKVGTIAAWRYRGKGPAYTKIGGAVVYSLAAVLEWESKNTINPEAQRDEP